MIKLALTDLDDTLIPFGMPHASERTVAAVHAAQEVGVHFGPVTGRPPCAMGWMFPENPECFSTGAFSNGQVIHVDGERVHVVGIERSVLVRVSELADELGDAYLVVYSLDDLGDTAYVTKKRDRLLSCPPPFFGTPTKHIVPELDRDYVKANLQFASTVTREQAEEIRHVFKEQIPELDFIFPGKGALIDLCPHGWTKGSAALVLAEHLGIEPNEIAVFGDSENDLGLMQAIPNSVAVANADAVVEAQARWHIGDCRDGAVDDALFDIATAAASGEMPRFMR